MTFNAELFDRAFAAYDEDPPFFRTLGQRLVDVAALPPGALELRAAVIDSLERLHPTQGRDILAAPRFVLLLRPLN